MRSTSCLVYVPSWLADPSPCQNLYVRWDSHLRIVSINFCCNDILMPLFYMFPLKHYFLDNHINKLSTFWAFSLHEGNIVTCKGKEIFNPSYHSHDCLLIYLWKVSQTKHLESFWKATYSFKIFKNFLNIGFNLYIVHEICVIPDVHNRNIYK